MFFEGSEKKFELFVKTDGSSLRNAVEHWETVVAKANAQVLSKISSQGCDAYLLSESSLFVFDNQVVMITCGTTSLIDAAMEVLDHVGVDRVEMMMYERKNELCPEDQPSDFKTDSKRLLERLPAGKYHTFGDADGHYVQLFSFYTEAFNPRAEDVTLEILMHDLGEKACETFTRPAELPRIYEETRINAIFPGFHVNDFLFEPAGYSLNALRGSEYYTFHVTPESHCSYASFETNHVFSDDLSSSVEHVLQIFEPGTFTIVFFSASPKPFPEIKGYHLESRDVRPFAGYEVIYYNYRADKPARQS